MNFLGHLKNLSKNTIYFGIGGAAVKFISFFTAPILTRVFAPSDFGIIDLINTSLSFFLMFASINITSGLLRYYYELKEFKQKKKLVSTTFISVIAWGFLLLIIFLLLKSHFSLYLHSKSEVSRNYSLFLTIIFIRIPFNIIHTYFLTLLILRKKVKTYISITLLQVFLNLILLIFFLLILKIGLPGAFLSGTLSIIIVSFLSYIMNSKFIGLNFSKNYLKQVLHYALPQFPGVFFAWGIIRFNRFFLQDLSSETQLGYFAIASKVALIVGIAMQSFRLAWGPYSMELIQKKNYGSIFDKFFKASLIMFSIIAFIITIYSKLVLNILATQEYMAGYVIIIFIVFALTLDGINRILGIGIAISKKTKYLSYALGITFIFSLLINYVFIKQFMALGAGIALLLCFVVKTILIYYFAQKVHPISFSLKNFIHFFLIFIFAGTTVLLTNNKPLYISLLISLSINIIVFIYIWFLWLKSWERNKIASILRIVVFKRIFFRD